MGRWLLPVLLPILMAACATPAAPNIGSTRAALTVPNPGPLYAAADFGAVPDDGLDDLPELQAAVHAAILQRRPLVLEAGLYHISDTLFIGGDHALCGPGAPLPSCSFISLTMRGETSGAHAGNGAQIQTMFGTGRLDRPAINIQGARDVRLENLLVSGENDVPRNGGVITATHIDPDPAAWACPTCSIERHSPYAGIVVDGYSGDEPADGYPVGRIGYFGESDPTHSSFLDFDTVSTDSFAVGIAINPSPNESNAEDISLRRVKLRYGAYGLAIGGSQSRAVTVEETDLTFAHTLVTTTAFGGGKGPPPFMWGGNLGAAVQLFDYRHTQGVAAMDGVHAEGYAWIGSFGLANSSVAYPVSITAADFHAYNYDYRPPFAFTAMGPVSFRGSTFRDGSGRAFSYLLSGPAATVDFTSCTFALFGDGIEAGYRPFGAQMMGGAERQTTATNSAIVWGSITQALDTETDYWVAPPQYLSPHVRRLYDAHLGVLTDVHPPLTSSHAVTDMAYDYATNIVTFDAADPGAFTAGDWLLSWATSTANPLLGGWVPGLRVTGVNGSTVTASMRVSGIEPGTMSTVWRAVPPVPE